MIYDTFLINIRTIFRRMFLIMHLWAREVSLIFMMTLAAVIVSHTHVDPEWQYLHQIFAQALAMIPWKNIVEPYINKIYENNIYKNILR